MRRENRNHIKKMSIDKIIIYSMIGIAIFVIAIIAILVSMNNSNQQEKSFESTELSNLGNTTENTTITSTQMGKSLNEVNNETTVPTAEPQNTTNTTVKEVNEANNDTSKNTVNKATVKEKETKKEKAPTFTNPLPQGQISKAFSDKELLYSETLEEWTTHNGIDIKAEEGAEVLASESGTVKSIKNDPRQRNYNYNRT